MQVAVVGAGIFGCVAAVELARAGHSVTLFDKAKTLLAGASGHNQFRLHRGYHYPRSPETGQECRDGLRLFEQRFPLAVMTKGRQYYALAAKDSLTSPEEYEAFLCKSSLMTFIGGSELVNTDAVARIFMVLESRYDPYMLRRLVEWELKERKSLRVRLGEEARGLAEFDRVVVATYADTGKWTGEHFQFEVVEKPVLWLDPDDEMRNTGIVVMDGPFCSLDPLGDTGLHVMGHVEFAIHDSNHGTAPIIPQRLRPFINAGVIDHPIYSHAPMMMRHGAEFIPALKRAKHVGSMFTVRTVLPNLDATDARPTLVNVIDERTIRIFSGKVPTCVTAAKEVRSILDKQDGRGELAA